MTAAVSVPEGTRARALRGYALFKQRADEIEDLGDGIYAVPSASRPGIVHEVDIESESCSCEDWHWFGSRHDVGCFHVFAVSIKLAHERAARRSVKAREPIARVVKLDPAASVSAWLDRIADPYAEAYA